MILKLVSSLAPGNNKLPREAKKHPLFAFSLIIIIIITIIIIIIITIIIIIIITFIIIIIITIIIIQLAYYYIL